MLTTPTPSEPDEEVSTLMSEHDLDEETAEKMQELVNDGLDEDEAIELA